MSTKYKWGISIMKKTGSIVLGLVLIIPSIFILLKNIGIFNLFAYFKMDFWSLLHWYWPTIFLVLPGIILHIVFLPKVKDHEAMLFFAGVFLVSGLVAQISYTYQLWTKLWPGFILSIAIGMFELYLFGKGSKGILIFVSIFTGLSALFFSKIFYNYYNKELIFPILFIVTGLIIMFGSKTKRTRV